MYGVAAVSATSVKLVTVPATLAIAVPPREMVYRETATLSVDAVQVSVALLGAVELAAGLVGLVVLFYAEEYVRGRWAWEPIAWESAAGRSPNAASSAVMSTGRNRREEPSTTACTGSSPGACAFRSFIT